MYDGELLDISCLTFFLQIFSKICFCLKDIIKIVWLLLAAVSINGLRLIIIILPLTKTRHRSRFTNIIINVVVVIVVVMVFVVVDDVKIVIISIPLVS